MNTKIKKLEIEERRKISIKTFIHGKFIAASTSIKKNDLFFIKMSEIKSIQYISSLDSDEEDICSFNTYKDHTYYTFLDAFCLMNEINNVLIREEKKEN